MSNWWIDLSSWLQQNVLNFVQTLAILVSITIAIIEFRKSARTNRLSTTLEITTSHRHLWSFALSDPDLSRVLLNDIDLKKEPITDKEKLFVTLLIAHVSYVFRAHQVGLYKIDEASMGDIARIFSLPIPNAVWSGLRIKYDKQFVNLVDRAMKTLEPAEHRKRGSQIFKKCWQRVWQWLAKSYTP